IQRPFELDVMGSCYSGAVFFFEALQTAGGPLKQDVTLFLIRNGDWNVRGNALLVNDLMTWGIILCGREPECRAIAQRQYALHGAFSECLFAQNNCSFQILQATGHNLGSARASQIDQHYDRKMAKLVSTPHRVSF